MTSANQLLEVLYDCRGMFLTVGELLARSGLDERRLARALTSLRERGHVIEETPLAGLRLVCPVNLDAHLIERELRTLRVGRNAICFGEVTSTNDVAFDSARQARSDGLVVLAELQTKGRGRLGRKWVSPRGANILMSVLLHDAKGQLPDEALTIAAGLAAAEGIEQVCGVGPELKWPNDLAIDGAKLAGILVEVRGSLAGRQNPRQIVIGIGVNVNAAPPASVLGRAATCLADQLGHGVERIEVVRAILRQLDIWIAEIQHGQLEDLHGRWMARCGMLNQRARIASGGREYVGRVLDVSPLEGLILAQDHGAAVHLPAQTSSMLE